MNSHPKRVAIVERHPIVRERLVELIAADANIECCGEADSFKDAMALIHSAQPHLVITGITLKDSNGLDLIKQIKALSLPMAVLVLSGHNEALYAKRIFAAGAMGFISKDCPSREILAAVRKILAGELCFSSTVMASGTPPHGARAIAAPIGRSISQLSDRELEVLEEIGKGMKTREIARDLQLSLASIDTYRARIKEKLNLLNAFELVSFAIRWLDSL